MSSFHKKPDWSKPPQGGLDHCGGSNPRPESSLGLGCLNFFLVTAGVYWLLTILYFFLYREIEGNTLVYAILSIISPGALVCFFLGALLIPVSGLIYKQQYRMMIAFILRNVNNFSAISILACFFLITIIEFVPVLRPISVLYQAFIPGYILVIMASAICARDNLRNPIMATVIPEIEGLENFKPTDNGQREDEIARF